MQKPLVVIILVAAVVSTAALVLPYVFNMHPPGEAEAVAKQLAAGRAAVSFTPVRAVLTVRVNGTVVSSLPVSACLAHLHETGYQCSQGGLARLGNVAFCCRGGDCIFLPVPEVEPGEGVSVVRVFTCGHSFSLPVYSSSGATSASIEAAVTTVFAGKNLSVSQAASGPSRIQVVAKSVKG